MSRAILPLLLSHFVLLASPALAAPPAPEEIVRRMTERTALGFDSGTARINMVLTAEGSEPTRRRLVTKSTTDKDLKRYRVRFQSPADVEGTTLLFRENPGDQNDDMYLYLPAFKRTRRIAGSQKTGAFMGSDFTYADMENRDVKSATYRSLPDVVIDGVECYHLIAVPRSDELYSKLELWVRKDSFLAQQIKFFDKKGDFLKAYRLIEAKRMDGRWVAARSQMWTKRTSHSTVLEVEALDTRVAVSPTEFSPESLSE
ncbi:MAG: outer membrane lipoprotein-sorting protein [Deltaproteobacteria bacterium]|nr:outer membrane lipoprotein-sorting protein [Deltaproteobacteria bacterium]